MKLALVASSYVPRVGALERHVHQLAAGLTRRGVEVEVLTQERRGEEPAIADSDGFVVRRFVGAFGNGRFAIAPGLWDHLRRTAGSFDVVHTHSEYVSLAVAAAQARPRQLIFTPHAPLQRLMRGPYGPMIRFIIGRGAHIFCTASSEAEFLQKLIPAATGQVTVVPHGVDVDGIAAARPFAHTGIVVLVDAPLERWQRIDKAIAAMPALDPVFRLVVLGRGPARERLLAHAGDLRVTSRVTLLGAVDDGERYRWLRTAGTALALAEHESSTLGVAEALCAGVQLVASDTVVHREAASYADGQGVSWVSPLGSPLEVAEAVDRAAALRLPRALRVQAPTWNDAVDRVLDSYSSAIETIPRLPLGCR